MTTKIHLLIWDNGVIYRPLSPNHYPHGDGKVPFIFGDSDGDGSGQGRWEDGMITHGNGFEYGYGDRRGNGGK